MQKCNYLGMTIDVWYSRESWFWRVTDAQRDGGTIGAARSEAEALRDACLSIEETSLPAAHADLMFTCVLGWERTLAGLARYLTHDCGATA